MTNPDSSAIYQSLTEIFRDVFLDDSLTLTPELSASDVNGWDSLKMVNVLVAVEKYFDIKIRSREVDALQCVGDLVDLIVRKTQPHEA